MSIWVVVADAGRARFFQAEDPKASLQEMEDLVHPEARKHANEMASDEPGTTHDSSGQGQHGMGHQVDPKTQEAIRFAKEVADRLEAGRNAGEIDRVYLIAPPKFLGLLRESLSDATSSLVEADMHKELTAHSVEDIRAHLPPRL